MTTRETMLKLMSLPVSRFDGVVYTSDGCYIAKAIGDCGYNAFLGKPQPVHNGPGRDQMLETWAGLTPTERKAVHVLAAAPGDGSPIPLSKHFGVPSS